MVYRNIIRWDNHTGWMQQAIELKTRTFKDFCSHTMTCIETAILGGLENQLGLMVYLSVSGMTDRVSIISHYAQSTSVINVID